MDVALLAEGVDRNSYLSRWLGADRVALLAEGVDRNFEAVTFRLTVFVALLAEGVDRNRYQDIALVMLWSRPPRGGRG